MRNQSVATRSFVELLSGFGPYYHDLMEDSNAHRSLFGSCVWSDVVIGGVKYSLKFQADYDLPGSVYLSRIVKSSTGEEWCVSSSADDAYAEFYPLDWAWV